jgi:hypothetical protein
MKMRDRERFKRLMNFEKVDRLPVVEWAGWWDKTINRWYSEGLPINLKEDGEIRAYFNFDTWRQYWTDPKKETIPENRQNYKPIVTDIDSYNKIKEHLYPKIAFDRKLISEWADVQRNNDMVVWVTLEGFYWVPRTLLGIEEINYMFYDDPELMHQINKDTLKFNLRVFKEFCQICKPDFMTFAEDMSYNHGPLISKATFEEFMLPYYKEIIPIVKENGSIPFIDTDGNPETLLPWFLDIGIEGFLPMERQAGTDIVKYRERYPKLKIIGAFDKTLMNKGEDIIRKEFERLLPIMKQGGYVLGIDHQTPPSVSLQEYEFYLKLLREYAIAAMM